MATLDQLPADRRAIIELVLRRGRSYEQLSEMLDMPEPRVREHARDALAALAPRSADRVDPHWREQIADYVLGQQRGPEAKATRAHLKGSEAARTWALSVLDSVGQLYPPGAEPDVPDRDDRRADPGGKRPAKTQGAAAATPSPRQPPSARLTVLQRRVVAGMVVFLAVGGLVLLGIQVLGDDDEEAMTADTTEPTVADQAQSVARLILRPVAGGRGEGGAVIAEQSGQPVMVMRAKLPATDKDQSYVVWLFNSRTDAVPVAAGLRGNLQTLAPLPADFARFRFVDVSLQRKGGRRHSGNSVLRAPIKLAGASGGRP